MKSHSSLVPPARFATFMAMVMLFSDTVSQSQAAVTVYSGFITVNDSDYPGDIALDDVFSYTMTVDDSITDSDPSTTDAFFTNAITGFTMARVSGSGAWNPSGVFSLPASFTISNYGTPFAYPNYPDFTGTGFPTLGGSPFEAFNLGFSSDTAPNDTGSGQTLADVYGGLLTAPQWHQFESTFVSAAFTRAFVEYTIEVSSVPEPSRILFAALGFVSLILRRRR